MDKYCDAIGITAVSLVKIRTIGVDIISLDRINPPISKKSVIPIIEIK